MPLSTPPALQAEHLSFSYGTEMVLDDVSFEIPAGEYVGVVGPNGGGKTTLLRIIVGLLEPEHGAMLVFGQAPNKARRDGRIGYVPQRIVQSDFAFPATVREMVSGGLTSRLSAGFRLTDAEKEAVDRALELTGTSSFGHRLVSDLSGGQRQRVFIARAIATKPKLLILDEPTTGVDVPSREAFYALLKDLHRTTGITILFVSHDTDVMTTQVDTVLCLNQKLVCHTSSHSFAQMGSLQEIYGHDASFIHHHHR